MPHLTLVLGYVLLTALFLWFIIPTKEKWVIKFCLIPVVVWYGFFLYYVPPQLSGYPTTEELTEEKVVVRFFTHRSPTIERPGAIFVVVDDRFFKKEKIIPLTEKMNPKYYINLSEDYFLRFYELPWEENMIKKMQKASKEGKMIILSKKKQKKKQKNGKTSKKTERPDQAKGKKGGSIIIGEDSASGSNDYVVETLTPNEVFPKEGKE